MRPNPDTADRVAIRVATTDRVAICERLVAVTRGLATGMEMLSEQCQSISEISEHLWVIAITCSCDLRPLTPALDPFLILVVLDFPPFVCLVFSRATYTYILHYSTDRKFLLVSLLRFAPARALEA